MPKALETTLEINLSALKHNYDFLKSKLQKNTLFLAVVKAFAYGSDSGLLETTLKNLGLTILLLPMLRRGLI